MMTRKPIVAGQFYPDRKEACVDEINEYLGRPSQVVELPEMIAAGIVPHAGWFFSGRAAGLVFSAVKQRHEKVGTFVIFGAAHSYYGTLPAVYGKGNWSTPLGEVDIDEELADAMLDTGTAVSDPAAHSTEHSIEVQVPFIQYLFADAKILPVIVAPTKQAVALGTEAGRIVDGIRDKKIVCIGSTDLTHYGPRYGFEPMGASADGIRWAHQVNDRKFIDLALALDAEGLLSGAIQNCNACGPGAAAAAVAAAKKLGKTKGTLLVHTNSNEVMLSKMGRSSSESVGYAAIVF